MTPFQNGIQLQTAWFLICDYTLGKILGEMFGGEPKEPYGADMKDLQVALFKSSE